MLFVDNKGEYKGSVRKGAGEGRREWGRKEGGRAVAGCSTI